MKVLKDEKGLLEVELEGERHGFPNALVAALLEDPDVDMASYTLEHPLTGSPKLFVRVKRGKDAHKALKAAAEKLLKDFKDFEKQFKGKFG